jgi:hypothetical protein
MLLKAVNGKHLVYGEYFDNEESVKEAIVKAVIICFQTSNRCY